MDEVSKMPEHPIRDYKVQPTELALPNELPKKPDLSHLPDHVLRSNALETLLQQNNELMSRLSVNLRRISHLENKIDSQEKIIKKFEHNYEIFKDEVFILKNKTTDVDVELQNEKDKCKILFEKHHAIQLEYSKLFQESNSQKKHFLNTTEKQKIRLTSLIKFKNNISPLIKEMKIQNKELSKDQNLLKDQNHNLKLKLGEITHFTERLRADHEKEKSALIQNLEENKHFLKNKSFELKDKLKNSDLINEKLIQAKNELIFQSREHDNAIKEYNIELNSIIEESKMLKREFKKVKLEKIKLKDKYENTKNKLQKETTEQMGLSDQLENTQLIFSNVQKELEKEQAKAASLQKINRQLSQEMNAYRSTIKALRDQRDTEVINPTPIQLNLNEDKVASGTELKTSDKKESTAISNISNLIFEIEKDFR